MSSDNERKAQLEAQLKAQKQDLRNEKSLRGTALNLHSSLLKIKESPTSPNVSKSRMIEKIKGEIEGHNEEIRRYEKKIEKTEAQLGLVGGVAKPTKSKPTKPKKPTIVRKRK
jgi:methylthioribose-1-phosphate isomerase